jgi:hypothetical protein
LGNIDVDMELINPGLLRMYRPLMAYIRTLAAISFR